MRHISILQKNLCVTILILEILEELLSLGGLGIQYCIKSELALFKNLQKLRTDLLASIIASLTKSTMKEI